MSILSRLKKVERVSAPVLSRSDQAVYLDAFIKVETMVRGEPPTVAEIQAERDRLSRPIKPSTPKERERIAKEIERIVFHEE